MTETVPGADRVRIELCDVMMFSLGEDADMAPTPGVEIWLSDDEGKVRRSTRPDVIVTGATRPEVLRRLADWIEANDDGDLSQLATRYADAHQGRRRPAAV